MFHANLLRAALELQRGDVGPLVQYIEAGADLERRLPSQETLLMFACALGNECAVNLLLQAGSSLTARDVSGRVALHYAVEFGHVSVVEILLRAGADPKRRVEGPAALTPVHIAVATRHEDIVSTLWRSGAPVEEPCGVMALTPGHVAAALDDVGCLRELREGGALLCKPRRPDGYTPLVVAVRRGCLQAAQYLASLSPSMLSPMEGGYNAFHAVVSAPDAPAALVALLPPPDRCEFVHAATFALVSVVKGHRAPIELYHRHPQAAQLLLEVEGWATRSGIDIPSPGALLFPVAPPPMVSPEPGMSLDSFCSARPSSLWALNRRRMTGSVLQQDSPRSCPADAGPSELRARTGAAEIYADEVRCSGAAIPFPPTSSVRSDSFRRAAEALEYVATVSGPATKEGHVMHTWRPRWLVLNPSHILYFRRRQDAELAQRGQQLALGVLRITPSSTCTPCIDGLTVTVAGLLRGTPDQLTLRFDSQTQCRLWEEAINSAIRHSQDHCPESFAVLEAALPRFSGSIEDGSGSDEPGNVPTSFWPLPQTDDQTTLDQVVRLMPALSYS